MNMEGKIKTKALSATSPSRRGQTYPDGPLQENLGDENAYPVLVVKALTKTPLRGTRRK
jgi:hypothetical protein